LVILLAALLWTGERDGRALPLAAGFSYF